MDVPMRPSVSVLEDRLFEVDAESGAGRDLLARETRDGPFIHVEDPA
jgi:hypothetical protein